MNKLIQQKLLKKQAATKEKLFALRRVAMLARRVARELEGTPYDEGGSALVNLTRALDRAGF